MGRCDLRRRSRVPSGGRMIEFIIQAAFYGIAALALWDAVAK
ncbi:hypothetical protein PODOV044v1_p0001 [Vibrio phage 23E28.1]|nr:hypothetical protein PODOV044v1_p0001 [Vibrio phage 23E28.1]QZI92044.1 hypothetical protein PODOV045v1_p0002 [Vibrio phage 69E27.1]